MTKSNPMGAKKPKLHTGFMAAQQAINAAPPAPIPNVPMPSGKLPPAKAPGKKKLTAQAGAMFGGKAAPLFQKKAVLI